VPWLNHNWCSDPIWMRECTQLAATAPRRRPLVSSCLALSRFPASCLHSLIHFLFGVYHLTSILGSTILITRLCLSSRKISITSPTGTMSARRTVTGRAEIARRAQSQRVLPKVWLIDSYYLRSTYTVSFTSQGSLPRTLQILQGRLLYRRSLVSLLPRK
jgi:hypothetical protein